MCIAFRIDGDWCARRRPTRPSWRCALCCRRGIGLSTTESWLRSGRRFAIRCRRGARAAKSPRCARESESRTRAEGFLSQMEISGKLVRLGLILLTVCLLAGCRAVAGGDSADDAKNWQGTWKLVSTIYDGQPQTADMEWIVDGDHYTIRLDGQQHVHPYPF